MKKVLLVFDTDKLPGINPSTVINKINKLLKDTALYVSMSQAYNPYGDGKSYQKIVNLIKEKYAK